MSEQESKARVQIFTFGLLNVIRDGQSVAESDWHTRKARQLLKMLITERSRPVSTDRLIEAFWPTSTIKAGSTTLRSAINALRKVLEPDRRNRAPSRYIHTKAPGYAFYLHEDIWLDVDAFERFLDKATEIASDDVLMAAPSDAKEQRQLLEAAIALYKDDYLTSDPYADWAQQERERLRERYFDALLQLAKLQAGDGNYSAAIASCRRVLARDEVRENAYQALMRYQAASGDSAAALITYERCRTILADELGADPSPRTQDLHQLILNGEIDLLTGSESKANANAHSHTIQDGQNAAIAVASDGAPTDATPFLQPFPQRTLMPVLDENFIEVFIGREEEISQIVFKIDEAFSGNGNLLVMEGEAGVGKTRLAYHLLQLAEDESATVISTACQPLERQLPFAPLTEGIGRYLQQLSDAELKYLPAQTLLQLAQIIPSLYARLSEEPVQPAEARLGADENRQRLIDEIIVFFETLAHLRPLVLFIDDLHWADTDTLAVLSRLSRRLSTMPLFLFLAYRTEDLAENQPLGQLLYTFKRTQQNSTLALKSLNPQQVATFVQQVTGREDQQIRELASLLYDTTHGNALYVTESIHALSEYGPIDVKDARDVQEGGENDTHLETYHLETYRQVLSLRRNQRVQEIIIERIERLPLAALEVLQLAATIGRDFDLDLLETAAIGDPIDGLELLLARKFLIERPDERLDFGHQIVRQVAYDSMSILQRRRLHRRVGDALVQIGLAEENPREAAFHFDLAGSQAQQDFALYSVLAGEKMLTAYGFRQAIEHFDDAFFALEALPNADAELVGRALQGRGLAYESLLDSEGMTESYHRLQKWARQQGDHQTILTAHHRLISMLSLVGQQRESNEHLLELLEIFQLARNGQRGTGSAGSHLTVAYPVLADLVARRGRIFYGTDLPPSNAKWAHLQQSRPAVDDAVERVQQTVEPLYAVIPLFDYGWTLRVQGQFDDALACFEAVTQSALETGQQAIAAIAYHQMAVIARMRGDGAKSHELNQQSIEIGWQSPGITADLAGVWPRIASAFFSLQAGRVDVAERRLEKVMDFLRDHAAFRNHRTSAKIGLGIVALENCQLADAHKILTEALLDAESLYPYTHIQALLGLARIAHARAEEESVAKLLQQALQFSGQRSLIEEYMETVQAIVNLQPADAPIERLVQEGITLAKAAGLQSPIAKLQSAVASL